MMVTRHGKCDVCQKPTTVRRDFNQTVDIFDPSDTIVIKGDLKKELLEFQKEPMFCQVHSDD